MDPSKEDIESVSVADDKPILRRGKCSLLSKLFHFKSLLQLETTVTYILLPLPCFVDTFDLMMY